MISVCRKRKHLCTATRTKIQSVLSIKHTLIGNLNARHTCGARIEKAWECTLGGLIANLMALVHNLRNGAETFEKTKKTYKELMEYQLEELQQGSRNYSALTETEANNIAEYEVLADDCWEQVHQGEPLRPQDKTQLVKIMREIKKLSKLEGLADDDKKTLENLWNLTALVLSMDTDIKKDLMEEKKLEKEITRKKAKTKK